MWNDVHAESKSLSNNRPGTENKKSLKEKSADFSVSRQQMNRDFPSSSCRPRAHIASLLILKFILCLYYIPHRVFLLLHQLQKCNVIFALFLGAPTIQTFLFAVIAIVLRMKSEWERVMRYNRRVSVAYMLMWYLGKERLFTSWVRFSLIFPSFRQNESDMILCVLRKERKIIFARKNAVHSATMSRVETVYVYTRIRGCIRWTIITVESIFCYFILPSMFMARW